MDRDESSEGADEQGELSYEEAVQFLRRKQEEESFLHRTDLAAVRAGEKAEIQRKVRMVLAEDAERLQRLQFVDLPRSTPEERTRTILELERIYNQDLIPTDKLVRLSRGEVEPLKEAMKAGGFLYPFETVRPQLARELPEPNYFAYGLRDPTEENRLVTYSTGYYPRFRDGSLGTDNGYEKHVRTHLDKIACYNQVQYEWWLQHIDRVILFDTVGVEMFDSEGKPATGKGRGRKMMTLTCKQLRKVLPPLPPGEDYRFLSYRFGSLLPLGAYGVPLPWSLSHEFARNSASQRLFRDFAPLGTHEDDLTLEREDTVSRAGPPPPGQPERRKTGEAQRYLRYKVVWYNEYQMLGEAFNDTEDAGPEAVGS